MARLIDRILAEGCRPVALSDLVDTSELAELFADEDADVATRPRVDPDAMVRRLVASEWTSSESLDPALVEGVPVIVADNVADFCQGLPTTKLVTDVVSTLAPPFPRFWLEWQSRTYRGTGVTAAGLLVEAKTTKEVVADHPEVNIDAESSVIGWILHVRLVAESRKGHPFGPVWRTLITLDDDGESIDKGGFFGGESFGPELDAALDTETKNSVRSLAGTLALPCLMAISFLHCKNVDVRDVTPPDALSRKHRRRTGRPLVRYKTLEIDPMRRELERGGSARTNGLGTALHIYRGHFKAFTADAPLMGRHVGRYWWASHVRGNPSEGVVVKDYRVLAPSEDIGRAYEAVDEHAEFAPVADENLGRDPDLGARGLRAHNRTQNLLAAAVEKAGWRPRRPRPEEPPYDLGWSTEKAVWIAEVKSLTLENEESQLRIAIGQVLRYCQLLECIDDRPLRPLIASEREPHDRAWTELCSEHGIVLTWPERFDEVVVEQL